MGTTAWSSWETVLELEGSSWEREASRMEAPALSMMALGAPAQGLSTMAQVGKSSWAAPELEQARSRTVPWALVLERSKMGLVESSWAVLVPSTREHEGSSWALVLEPSMKGQEGNSLALELVPSTKELEVNNLALELVPSLKELEVNNLALELVPVLSRMGLEVSSSVALAPVPSKKEPGGSSWAVLAPQLSRRAGGEMSRRSSWETEKGQSSSGREREKETSQGNRIRQKKSMALRKR